MRSIQHFSWPQAGFFALAGIVLAVMPFGNPASGHSVFTIRPDPPSAGGDVEVVYSGSQPGRVEYRIGDGASHSAKVGKGRKFKIPKRLLKAGKRLYLRDGNSIDASANLCVDIEPSS